MHDLVTMLSLSWVLAFKETCTLPVLTVMQRVGYKVLKMFSSMQHFQEVKPTHILGHESEGVGV
jgi:hypothetical protein